MINIAFIGNCQMVSLAFFTQSLKKDYEIRWVSYGKAAEEFNYQSWANKCENKIFNNDYSIDFIKKCDYVFYQKICEKTSELFNEDKIKKYINNNCKLISLPSIWIDNSDYNNSINELKKRELQNQNNIIVTDIIEKYNSTNKLFHTVNHPTTFLFIKIMEKIAAFLNVDFFDDEETNKFLLNDNYMELLNN